MTDLDEVHSRLDAALVRYNRRTTPEDEEEMREAAWDALRAIEAVIVRMDPARPNQTEVKEFDEICYLYTCGVCDAPIDRVDRYCRHCGKKVAWGG